MSETFDLADEPPESPEPKSTREPVAPLKRLWKEEPDSIDEEAPSKKKSKTGDEEQPRKKSKSVDGAPVATKGKAKPAKSKGSPTADEPTSKKVLLEETPALDTYETRQRARLIVGGLIAGCAALALWILYSVFRPESGPSDLGIPTGDSLASPSSPEPRPSVDQEARFMFNRAREMAKSGRTDQAVAMLNKVIKVYKGTPTAAESKAALERGDNNLPLFSDSPLLVAERKEKPPAPATAPPPAIVNAAPEQPKVAQGQAQLVLPSNAAEAMVVPPTTPGNTANPGRQPESKLVTTSRPLPSGFEPNLAAGFHESGWPRVIAGPRDGGPMVLVPGGTFRMGSSEGQPAEGPEHQVRLSTYYIDEHEVTNRQFRVFLSEAHYRGQPPGKWLTDEKAKAEPDDAPAVFVNFQDAEAFAAWAGKQIPTEAQWEMAARSSDGRRFPWGDESPKWAKARNFRQIDPIRTYPEDRSPYGAFDMAGNVQEWVRDWFDHKYYQTLARTVAENPAGPTINARSRTPQRTVRGASKTFSVTYREGVPPEKRLPYLGFRCVLVVEDSAPPPAAAGAPGAPQAPPGSPASKKAGPPSPPPF